MAVTQKQIYRASIEKWQRLFNVSTWNDWSRRYLKQPKSEISMNLVADLYELDGWLIAMEYRWPNVHMEIQCAFENFRLLLENVLFTFHTNFKPVESEAYYCLDIRRPFSFFGDNDGDEGEGQNDVDECNAVAEFVSSPFIALTKAANHIIDLANKLSKLSGLDQLDKLSMQYTGSAMGPAENFVPEFSHMQKEDIYKSWTSGERELQLIRRKPLFLNPDFAPFKHRDRIDYSLELF